MAPDPVNTGVGKRMILDLMTAIATADPRDNEGTGKARRLFNGAPPKVLSISEITQMVQLTTYLQIRLLENHCNMRS